MTLSNEENSNQCSATSKTHPPGPSHPSLACTSWSDLAQGQADLLKYAKNETVENLKQIHYAAVSCGLNKPGTENADVQKPRRSLEVIPEKANDETGE
ncbi:hypothetical protein E5288_WYG000707 [Bos mutus]|uniref:Uncharacterized protein n=1 Tax=Bos mutus TaxID=72004 RepID=A0A6B0SI89_9CETA|nr:hypothetical protein [Bos mutus]